MKQPIYFTLATCLLLVTHTVGACATRPCISFSNFPNSDTETLWVPRAALADLEKHKKIAERTLKGRRTELKDEFFPLAGHRLIKGGTDILAYRYRFLGWPGTTDTSGIKNISIVTPRPLIGEGEISIGGPEGALVFVTVGSPPFRNFCYGYAAKGTLSYSTKRTDPDPVVNEYLNRIFTTIGADSVFVKIAFDAVLVHSKSWKKDCGHCVFEGNLVFKRTRLSETRSRQFRKGGNI